MGGGTASSICGNCLRRDKKSEAGSTSISADSLCTAHALCTRTLKHTSNAVPCTVYAPANCARTAAHTETESTERSNPCLRKVTAVCRCAAGPSPARSGGVVTVTTTSHMRR
jgi:hypothetical protein